MSFGRNTLEWLFYVYHIVNLDVLGPGSVNWLLAKLSGVPNLMVCFHSNKFWSKKLAISLSLGGNGSTIWLCHPLLISSLWANTKTTHDIVLLLGPWELGWYRSRLSSFFCKQIFLLSEIYHMTTYYQQSYNSCLGGEKERKLV